ncbi:UNVERIFIED_CONTAM: hypothetical protein HDU68_010127 [Siphonaria sp. JEL0065]|nr:hypothetical protein HDU68_010127 [Siphonaria sp. JEL0065]
MANIKHTAHKLPSLRSLPLEVVPIVFMIGTALTFGGYVSRKLLTQGEDLRIGSRIYNPDHWKGRLERPQIAKTPAQNVFYKHIQDVKA